MDTIARAPLWGFALNIQYQTPWWREVGNAEPKHNLFSNALKYSPPDQPVEVRGRIFDDQLEVLVVDRGIGVLPEDLGRVFDKFYRVADVGSSNGLGIGLAICKAFIEAHDGRISLENNPMGGTIVRFVIPFREAATSWENLKL